MKVEIDGEKIEQFRPDQIDCEVIFRVVSSSCTDRIGYVGYKIKKDIIVWLSPVQTWGYVSDCKYDVVVQDDRKFVLQNN